MEGFVVRMFVEEGSPTRQVSTPREVESALSSDAPTVDEARHVARARAGDTASFSWLFSRFGSLVHAIALSNGAREDVDDVSQDVFLAAWKALPDLRSDAHFGGWIAQIARHRAQQAARSRSSRRVNAPLERDVAAPDSSEATPDDVLHVLQTLPPAYRETLAMRLIEGLSGPEIAALTGLTHGSVRVNLTRGMELLRDALRERGWT